MKPTTSSRRTSRVQSSGDAVIPRIYPWPNGGAVNEPKT